MYQRPTLESKRAKLKNFPTELRVFNKLVEEMQKAGTVNLPNTHSPGGVYWIARQEGMPCDVSKLLSMLWQLDPNEILGS